MAELTTVNFSTLLLQAPILAALLSAVWTGTSVFVRWLIFRASLRTRKIQLDLNPKGDTPKEIQDLRVLTIRYGNDTYLTKIASEQDLHHGRLQNKVSGPQDIEKFENNNGEISIKVGLRVHKRLGTQFTLFLNIEGDEKPVVDYLKLHERAKNIRVENRPDGRKRVFFLLTHYPIVETVDGFHNNMIYPV